jgi:hypothetical protein
MSDEQNSEALNETLGQISTTTSPTHERADSLWVLEYDQGGMSSRSDYNMLSGMMRRTSSQIKYLVSEHRHH